MDLPTIENDGDALERLHWGAIKPSFPHYEQFWRMHLAPLRAQGSIFPRAGIDEDFEFLAMYHYSVFVYLSRSLEKIEQAGRNLRFPGEIYVDLYATTETAKKAVSKWSGIYQACVEKAPKINTEKMDELQERFRTYRNLVHEQLPAIRLDENSGALMLRPDKVETYQKWTDVIYKARPDDFVEVTRQLNNDYHSLCSALENIWKSMCEQSGNLRENKEYLRRQGQGGPQRTLRYRSEAACAHLLNSGLLQLPDKLVEFCWSNFRVSGRLTVSAHSHVEQLHANRNIRRCLHEKPKLRNAAARFENLLHGSRI